MKINLSFAELSEYIKTHYGKNLTFSKVSEKAMCVYYEQRILFKTMQIPVSISIENVATDSVTITYNGGFGIDMIISGAMTFLKAKLPEFSNAIIAEDGHKIKIELSRLSQTKALVEALTLREIQILEKEIQISALLK